MPRHSFRFLAALLLALVIPLQGMASVIGGQCMAFGHHQQDAAGHGSHDGHGDADAHDDGHGHAAHSHAADHPGDQDDDHGGHCGPCAACCASASIAGPAAFSISTPPSDVAYVFTQSPPPSVQPDGLDRPPLAL